MAVAVQNPELTETDAPTAEKKPLQLADIYRLRLVSQPAVSPDGRQVAFVIYGFREEKNERATSLWLAPSDGSAPPRRLTRSGNDSAPAWSPDGRALAFLSTRPDEPEMAPEKPPAEPRQQLWLLELDGGEPRQLTARPEGVISFDWSPDGTKLVFAARDPSEAQERYLKSIRGELDGAGGEHGPLIFTRMQHKWDGVGYLDEVRTHLFVVDVESREVRRLTDGPCDEIGPPWNRGGPRWSPRGDWIVFNSNRTGDADNNQRIDLWLISPDGDETRRLTFGDVNASEPRWAPDGASIAFIASQTPDALAWNTPALCWIDIEHAEPVADLTACVGEGWSTVGGVVAAALSGDPVAHAQVWPVALRQTPLRVLTAGLDRPVEGPPVWLNGDELLAPISDRGRTKLARVSVEGETTYLYPLGDERCTLHEVAAASGAVAMTVNRPAGTDLFTLPAAAIAGEGEPQPQQLTHLNQEIFGARAAVRYEPIEFPNSEGQTIAGIAVLPPGFDPSNGPLPLVLLPHGGPMGFDPPALQFYDGWFMGEGYLASQGYLVLMVNYRGSTSFGQDFSWVIRGDLGHREADDILSGVRYLIDKGWADPDRLFVTGVSYGGYLTAWVTGVRDQFKAAVSDLPAWDITRSYGASDLHTYFQQDHGLPWHNPEGYRTASPSQHVLNTTTPTLILAGEHDWRCPAALAEAYYVTLRKIGVPAELVIYQNEHHAITRPKRGIDRLARICRWFAQHGGLPFDDESAQGYPG
jgi:dipeptidyl aminopeptidase/acylaminoacyl peptidase